jgi:hypothetical protein
MPSIDLCNSACSIKKQKVSNRTNTKNKTNKRVYSIITKSPNCILTKINGQEVNALLDSGADLCVLRLDMYKKLQKGMSLKLNNSSEILRNASGKQLKVAGETLLTFQIGSQVLTQKCQVTSDIRVPFLLGTDFLVANDVRIWLARGEVTVNGESLPLRHYHQLSSLVRLCEKVRVPPQTAICTFGKIKRSDTGSLLCLTQAESSFLNREPGLAVMNSVSGIIKNKYVPLTITNATGREFCINAGCVVAKIEVLEDSQITSLAAEIQTDETDFNYADAKQFKLESEVALTSEEIQTFEKLIHDNSDVFSVSKYDLGLTDLVQCEIETGEHPPIKRPPYRTPYAYRGQVKQQITEMLKSNIIQPSKSPWSFPILCVPKKDTHEIRMCCDYRLLNDITQKYNWPLTQIEDSFNVLAGAKYFSSLDLNQGYHQVPMSPKSVPKTAFTCEMGIYEFKTMPFGLSNAPQIFSELMSKVLEGSTSALAYLDDILIFSRSFSDHVVALQDVFNRLRKANLKLKISKCSFLQKQLKFLGHIITPDGIKVCPEKVKCIHEMERPRTVRDVRSFIGCCSYYRKFIPDFAKIAYPLTQLTKKHSAFIWGTQQEEAFQCLKKALVEAPILKVPNFEEIFALYTDASNFAVGAVLTQSEDGTDIPVAYLSHQLNKTQQKWSVIEKEAYSIIYALQKFRHYLYGRHFKIYTDHKPLKYIHSAQMKNPKIQRWALEISSFGGTIEYIQGSRNVNADFLSRIKCKQSPMEPMGISVLNSDFLDIPDMTKPSQDSNVYDILPSLPEPSIDITSMQEADDKIKEIIGQLADDQSFKHYLMIDGILYHVNQDENLRLVLPQSLRKTVMETIHTGTLGSHIGRDKTYNKIHSRYYWEGMARDIHEYVGTCIVCKKANLHKHVPNMQETTVPTYPFEMVALDYAGPYPMTDTRNSYVLTVVDMFTGWVTPIPVPDKTAETTAKVIMQHIIPVHAVPIRILTDRGGEFRNKLMEELCQCLKISHIQTSPFSPQANGRCERTHRAMTSCLSKMCNSTQTNWDECLFAFSSAYNTSQSSATGFSAYYLLYGRDPVLPIDTILKPRRKYMGEAYFPQALERMHIAYRVVRKHLHKQTQRNMARKNVKDTAEKLQVGDPVYLKNNMRANKLQNKWVSHYRIIAQRGPVSFTIKHQLTGKILEAHAKDLRKASEKELWEVKEIQPKPRQATLAFPESDSEESSVDSNSSDTEADSDDTIVYEYEPSVAKSVDRSNDLEPDQAVIPDLTTPTMGNVTPNQNETLVSDHDKGVIETPVHAPDHTEYSSGSEWSEEDIVPLSKLRKEPLSKRKQRHAKTLAAEKLKKLKDILFLFSEVV